MVMRRSFVFNGKYSIFVLCEILNIYSDVNKAVYKNS